MFVKWSLSLILLFSTYAYGMPENCAKEREIAESVLQKIFNKRRHLVGSKSRYKEEEKISDILDSYQPDPEALECYGLKIGKGAIPGKNAFLAFTLLDESLLPLHYAGIISSIEFGKVEGYFGYYERPSNKVFIDAADLDTVDKQRYSFSYDYVKSVTPFVLGFGTILHEYGHSIDGVILNPAKLFKAYTAYSVTGKKSRSFRNVILPPWKEVIRRAETPTLYAVTNISDNFAEYFAAYFLDPLMKCYASKPYELFTQIFKANAKIYGSSAPFSEIQCSDHKGELRWRRFRMKSEFKSLVGMKWMEKYDLPLRFVDEVSGPSL